jgi:hypothetical protein
MKLALIAAGAGLVGVIIGAVLTPLLGFFFLIRAMQFELTNVY